MGISRHARRVSVALLFGIIAAVVIGVASVEAGEKVVRVGLIQPLSGNLSPYWQEGQPAFDYIINKINAEGGIKSLGGAKIDVVLADDASQGPRTASEARRLITRENVSMLVGTLLTGQMLGVSPVADEFKVPTLAMRAGGAKGTYVFSLGFPYDRGYAKSMVGLTDSLVKEHGQKIKTTIIASSNFEGGQQVNKFLKEMLTEKGFTISAEMLLDTQAQDHTAAMLRIRSMKPDAVMGLLQPRDGILLQQARYNLNYHASVFIANSPYSDQVIWRELGPEIGKAVLARNLFGMASYSPGAKFESMKALVDELKAKASLKSEVGQATIQAAQAARMVQAVLELAASADREAIYKAFYKVRIPFGDPNLYLARPEGLSFGEDRMPRDSTSMMVQWTEDRKHEVVWPSAYAEAKPRIRP